MITHQFVENIGRRLLAVHAEEKSVAEEMQRAEQTARARLQAMRDEAANIDALLDSLNRFDQTSIETFLAGAEPVAAPPTPVAAVVAAPPISIAPAAAEPAPDDEPAVEKPEARGLKDSDAKMLIVMRAHRGGDGVCRLTMRKIAEMAGIPQKTTPHNVRRLRTACIIRPNVDDTSVYHVSDKGERLPIAVPVKAKATPAPTTPPAPVSRPTATETELDDKVLDLLTRAALSGGGQALFDVNVLANKMEVNMLRLERSLGRLKDSGRIVRKPSVPGHVAIEVLGAEVAA